jgi:hypothetical protein
MEVEQSQAVSQHAVEDRCQVRERVAEDQHGPAFRRADDVLHETADHGIPQRIFLATCVETAEQVTQPARVLDRLVLGADPLPPSFAKARVQEGRPRARNRQRQENRVGDGSGSRNRMLVS